MVWQGLRKVPNKVNERILKSKGTLVIRIGNRIHRRVVFATMSLILVVILVIIISNSVSSTVVANADFMRGVGVGIYWDPGCTNRTLSFDWGTIEPGANNTGTVYVRNEGNSAVSLWMATSNWTPSVALDYLTVSWTYSGKILSADEVIPIDLILNVSPAVSGNPYHITGSNYS